MTKNIFPAAFALSLSLSATALTAAESNVEQVLVTATRTPAPLAETIPTAHVVTASDIARWQPDNLSQLLGRISGLDFRDSGGRGSVSGIFIRGAAPSQSLVLIDGVRAASATLGATQLQTIPVESIERIEIVKGPMSGLYGADAVGGVIQIFTKKGFKAGAKPVSGSLRHSIGSNGLNETTASVAAGNQLHQVQLTLSHEDRDGIDRTDLKTGGNQDRDAFRESTAALGAHLTLSDKTDLDVNAFKTENSSEFDNAFGTDTGNFSESDYSSAAVSLSHDASKSLRLKASLGYLKDEIKTSSSFPSLITTERDSADLQADYAISSSQTVSLGASYYNDKVETTSNFPEDERDNTGYFVQYQFSANGFDVLANVRQDDNEAYGEHTSGSVGAEYQVSPALSIALSYGTAFIAPTFNELYFPPFAPGFAGFGNPNLKPEESESAEISFSGLVGAHSQWRFSLYKTDVDDLIGGFPAQNINSATMEGAELEFSTQRGGWSFNANLDYLDARDNATNEYLADRAVWTANAESGWTVEELFFSLYFQAEHGRHDSNGLELSGFGVWGMNAIFTANDSVKLYLQLDNVFDKDYAVNIANGSASPPVRYNTAGRTVKAGVEFSF